MRLGMLGLIPSRGLRFVALLLLVVAVSGRASPVVAQTDTVSVVQRPLDRHSPNGALWRAAVLPGWGQVYNRQYLKLPLVYLGLGGITAAALYTNGRYLRYRHAYLFTASVDDSGNPNFPEYATDYARLLEELGLPPESSLTEEEIESRRARLQPQFLAQRNDLRRNRDLLYVGVVLWYGLSVLDAFVSAHLRDFDVGEDLSVTLYPDLTTPGMTAAIRWTP